MSDFNRWLGLIIFVVFVWLLFLLSKILIPFFIAAFLAYIGDPLVERLSRLGLSRLFGVIVVFVIFIAILFALVLLLIPMANRQIQTLISFVPSIIDWVQTHFVTWLHVHLNINIDKLFSLDSIKKNLATHFSNASQVMQFLIKTITASSVAIIEWGITLILIPVVTFYLMRDWKKLKSALHSLMPRSKEPEMMRLANECNTVFGAFIRGQLFVMIALGIIYSIGLSLVGLNIAIIIGIMAGLVSVVPYLGFICGLVTALITAAFQFNDFWHVLLVFIVFAIGYILEGMVLTPYLVGGRIGLHPVAVIFAVLAGGVLFGFFGVLLALPVATVAMVFVRYYRDRYVNSELYN